MATSKIILSTIAWIRITAANQSGICYKKTGNPILVDHTDQETAATLPLSNTNVTKAKAKRVPLDEDNGKTLNIIADNVDDVYYALALESGSNILAVDILGGGYRYNDIGVPGEMDFGIGVSDAIPTNMSRLTGTTIRP